ncbi:hypothetical protein QN277_025386 [Acacia crassicarpa]|nr:hypothetical protein QN277_025386 [Acacia crassicarpa]
MENIPVLSNKEEGQINSSIGFRFHPTDEELLTLLLKKKTQNAKFSHIAIAEVDILKYEPWHLREQAKAGEDEWYFFGLSERKYKKGPKIDRATEAGYWKSTGKDEEIVNGGRRLRGKKKILVFYDEREAPVRKTDWVMHEYRLDGKSSVPNPPTTAKNQWLICRVFKKTADKKRTRNSAIKRLDGSPPVSPSPTVVPDDFPDAVGDEIITRLANLACFSPASCDDVVVTEAEQMLSVSHETNLTNRLESNGDGLDPSSLPLSPPIVPGGIGPTEPTSTNWGHVPCFSPPFCDYGVMAEREQMLNVSHEHYLVNGECGYSLWYL